jgi:malate dehydrogenase (oxaloacetate-decarboxylating)
MSILPNAAFSIALDCQLDNVPGTLGRLCTAIGEAGGNIGALDGFDVRGPVLRRSLVVHCRDQWRTRQALLAYVLQLKMTHCSHISTPSAKTLLPL